MSDDDAYDDFGLDGGFLDENAASQDDCPADRSSEDPLFDEAPPHSCGEPALNVERPTPVHPSLFDRLRPLNALCEEPLSEGELETVPLHHFLHYLLRELPGRHLSNVAAACAADAAETLCDADDEATTATTTSRLFIYKNVFVDLARSQRDLRSCNSEVESRLHTLMLGRSARDVLQQARRELQLQCAKVREYVTSALAEVHLIEPETATDLLSRHRAEINEFRRVTKDVPTATLEPQGPTQGGITVRNAADNRVEPLRKDPANEDFALHTPDLQAGAKPSGRHTSMEEAVSPAVDPATTEPPVQGRPGRRAARNAAKKNARNAIAGGGEGLT